MEDERRLIDLGRRYDQLIHDLANPLVVAAVCVEELQADAASLTASQIELLDQTAEAVVAMETVIETARKELSASAKPKK